MFGSDRVTPEVLLGLGNLARGNNWGEQFANAGTGVLTAVNSQKDKAASQDVINKTAQMLEIEAPDIAVAVRNGALTATDGYKQFLERKTAAEKAKQPDYQFITAPNGQIIRAEKNSGQIQDLGNFAKPDMPAIAQEYEWAKNQGFKGTPQEYQVWKANLGKQKGMVVEYDPVNGFRMTQGDVEAKTKPLTEAEARNAGFYQRALTAEKELANLESEGTSVWNKAAQSIPVAGNYLVGENAQKFSQAKRNFINAVLRRESGAVISEPEFANAEQQYFPQPGDAPQVIAQKRKNREDAIAGFEISSGPAAERVRQNQTEPASDVNSLVEKYRTK